MGGEGTFKPADFQTWFSFMAIKFEQVPAGVAERLMEIPRAIEPVEGIAAFWVFGSWARGEATPLSDVDLAYLRPAGAPDAEKIDRQLYKKVVEALGTDEVSLLDVVEAPVHLQMRVLGEGRLVFEGDRRVLADWTERVLGNYPEIHRLRSAALDVFEARLKGEVMELDRERILELLRDVEQDLARLQKKLRVSVEAYLADEDAQDVVARRFQTAVEGCLNVANHIIARKGLAPATDYASAFRSLNAGGVISGDCAGRMADMARFRNLLVHLYWEVDHRRVYEAAGDRVKALEAFVKEIGAFLAQEEADS